MEIKKEEDEFEEYSKNYDGYDNEQDFREEDFASPFKPDEDDDEDYDLD